ncbi:MAG: L-threonylcarbamoyladenylate synthase, partial [Candidatus Eremiobacteraeota bacterium]|nr:L-threonylcarbamoyladenylate synthase [Candidatus Eremiobacteraeota bacterium]
MSLSPRLGRLPSLGQERRVPLCPATPETIAKAVALLRNGGVVAFPTETVYGLGALVWDLRAVTRIFELKGRPEFDPLIVHVADRPMLERLATRIPDAAEALIERFWPGPLTLVLEKQPRVPRLVTA